jgi:hypothetical protein
MTMNRNYLEILVARQKAFSVFVLAPRIPISVHTTSTFVPKSDSSIYFSFECRQLKKQAGIKEEIRVVASLWNRGVSLDTAKKELQHLTDDQVTSAIKLFVL